MLKQTFPLRLVAWLVILASPALVRAQALANRVPAETIFYVGWRGVDSPGPGFEGSHLQGVLADSNLPKVFDEVIPKVLDRIAEENKDAAEAVAIVRTLLRPMWRHPTAIAFVGVDINAKKEPRPKLVMLCAAGKEAEAIKDRVQVLLDKAGPTPFPISVIIHDDLVAVVVGYDNPKDAIPNGGPEGRSLAHDPDFIKSLEQVSKEGFVTAYFDVEKTLSLAEVLTLNFAPREIQQNFLMVRDKLGLKGIKRAIWTEGFDGKEWSSQVFVSAPAPRTGLLGSLIEGKPLSAEIIQSIPENASIAGAFHFDLAGLVDAVRTAAGQINPEVKQNVDQGFDQVNQIIGMDVQKDFLANLGDEWAYYNDPAVAGNGIVGVTLINRLHDAGKTEAALTKLEGVINQLAAKGLGNEKVTIAFRQVKVGDATIHYLGFPLITPAWAVQNGNLYLALYPEIVAAAVAHVPGKSKSIATNPAYAGLTKRLGEHPVSSFGFIDLPRLAPENYSSWLMVSHLANAADLFGVPAPIMILPPMDKLLSHLTAAGDVSWTDADGLHVRGLTPFPGSEIFAENPTNFLLGEAMMGMAAMRSTHFELQRMLAARSHGKASVKEHGTREEPGK